MHFDVILQTVYLLDEKSTIYDIVITFHFAGIFIVCF
jgi:hypothetical protein